MKRTLAEHIKLDPVVHGPYVIVRANSYTSLLYEVRGEDGLQHTDWYVSFSGNSKQRRQQQRKLLRDLNQE